MAFLLYQTEPRAEGVSLYRQVRHVTLAGNGLIHLACKDVLGDSDLGWTISSKDMLLVEGCDPGNHALVIDTSPRRPTVSLFEIRAISGYSYVGWTPLMLTLEQLFADDEAPGTVEAMKQEFDDRDCPRCLVRSFLYLAGGYAGGTWNWSGNSPTAAALLWDDAWSYFQQQATAVEPASSH